MQDDPELTAVVRSRQLHIYRNGKKVLVLAGKAAPKIIREDRICVFVLNQQSFFSNLYRLCCKQPFFLWPWLQSYILRVECDCSIFQHITWDT